MPHFAQQQTKMEKQEYLLQAIRDMGYAYRVEDSRGSLEVPGLGGKKTHVEIKVFTNISGYNIGFRKVGGLYEVVGDWICITRITRMEFMRRLKQRYAYYEMLDKIQQQGFQVQSEELQHGGAVRLVLKYASSE